VIAVTDILITVLAFVAGFVAGRIGKRGPASPKRASVTCDTCDHGRGFHTEGNGPCLAPVFHVDGVRLARTTTCKCQTWDGPTRPEDIIRDFQP
jgi:hypothetical protein